MVKFYLQVGKSFMLRKAFASQGAVFFSIKQRLAVLMLLIVPHKASS